MTVIRCFRLSLLLFCFLGLPSLAGPWPKIDSALDEWQGLRQVTLRSDLKDPLASPEVQRLLEFLLDRGFVVVPASLGTRVEEGLVLDLRDSGQGKIIALSSAPEGVIVAFGRLGEVDIPNATKIPSETTARAQDGDSLLKKSGLDDLLPGIVGLPGSPRLLALLESPRFPELLIMSDRSLDRYRFGEVGLEKIDSYSPPTTSSKALHVDAADLDGDGRQEIAAVWAVESGEIYGGMDAQIYSWIFSAEGALQPASPNLGGYLRLVPEGGFWQGRGAHRPFAGPVMSLARRDQEVNVGNEAAAWGQRSLYQATPIGGGEGVVWDSEDRLSLVVLNTGLPVPGGMLMEGLGPFSGPEVAVRKEEPEVRSGLGRSDRIWETYYPLPRRLVASEGEIYTISRGRTSGLPLIGRPSGKDQVVRIRRTSGGLRLDRPFEGIEAFILDFALLRRESLPPAIILLVNEKEDGRGKAWLLVQETSHGR